MTPHMLPVFLLLQKKSQTLRLSVENLPSLISSSLQQTLSFGLASLPVLSRSVTPKSSCLQDFGHDLPPC